MARTILVGHTVVKSLNSQNIGEHLLKSSVFPLSDFLSIWHHSAAYVVFECVGGYKEFNNNVGSRGSGASALQLLSDLMNQRCSNKSSNKILIVLL